MSLTVPPDLLARARQGEIADQAFLDCVHASLPYAWNLVEGLVQELEAGQGEFADNQVPPPDEAARGELLRLMASDAMRAAVFRPAATAALAEFTSPRGQLLNQRPDLVDC